MEPDVEFVRILVYEPQSEVRPCSRTSSSGSATSRSFPPAGEATTCLLPTWTCLLEPADPDARATAVRLLRRRAASRSSARASIPIPTSRRLRPLAYLVKPFGLPSSRRPDCGRRRVATPGRAGGLADNDHELLSKQLAVGRQSVPRF